MDLGSMIAVRNPSTDSKYIFSINDIEFICEREPIQGSDREYEVGLKSGRVIKIKGEVYDKLYHLFMDDDDE